MSRTFFERKKRRKSSGVEKGKLMEMNGRLQSEEEKCVCVCLKAQESERERERHEDNHLHCVFGVTKDERPDVFHKQDLTLPLEHLLQEH